MGHWHLNSGDVDANRKIFLALGGTLFKLGTFEIVKFPGVYVYLNMPQGAPPPAGGNDGAVVKQVGGRGSESARNRSSVESFGRAGATGRQWQSRSSVHDHTGWLEHRNCGRQEPEGSDPAP